ncbi:MAG: Mu transposase C-terminal domain-containing protein [Methylobacter sp.]|uniref:Mu transposase C-terminal domain-containing protein n=1 Tax=Candidatus Methylobacter titanis TaxID=3053457 RepID=A0AA43TIF3_9GAMM|nr:Mu transposase C-terminal domain-containing protein [Candidatus Methylobacter titanis]
MNDINRPASSEEIAAAIGKSKRSIERMAEPGKGNWKYSEEASHSRFKKRLYALKDLPKDLQQLIFTYRFNQGVNYEQQRQTDYKSSPTALPSPGNSPTNRLQGSGVDLNAVPTPVFDALGNPVGGCADPSLVSGHGLLGGNRSAAALQPAVKTDPKGSDAAPANSGTGADETHTAPGAKRRKTGVAVNPPRTDEGAHEPVSNGELSLTYAVATDERQRTIDGYRQVILAYVDKHPGSVKTACVALTQAYAAGTLSPDLILAINHSNDKPNAARQGKISTSTVGKWKQLKKKTGHCAPEKTRTKTNWKAVWWFPLLLCCYRKPQKPTLTEAYADFKKDWQAQGLALDGLPSYDAANRLLKAMPFVIRETGRRTGAELASLKAFVRRDWSSMSSNEAWVGDGHSFKAKVRHPRTGNAFAPEVTMIIDAASRFVVGWAFSLAENQIAVAEAIGQGMLKHGKPLIYYSDNGSGQTAKTIDCPIGGMLARMGVEHETGIPGNAQGRGLIEGLWDITMIAAAKTFPTFQGTGMDGDTLRKNTNAINSAKRKGEVPTFVPSWQEFMRVCEETIDTYNHEHKHSSLGGKTPADVYFANFDASWACPLTDDEALNLYRPFILRTPIRGELTWINNRYFNKVLVELPEKTKVRVAYDLHHADRVWISDLQGKFICIGEWNGNQVAGFAKSKVEALADNRRDGIVKLAQSKIDEANHERYGDIEGEVLERIPTIHREQEPELIRVPVPVREKEEALKPFLFEGNFNKQGSEEEEVTSYQDLAVALYKNKTGNS